MSAWTIAVISPREYLHSATFNDAAFALDAALRDLGHSTALVAVSETTEVAWRENVLVFGANLLAYHAINVPAHARLFNLEQPGSEWFTPKYFELLRAHEVWDYAPGNAAYLAEFGITTRLCRIGFHSCLTRIEPVAEPSIDVLFYGSNTARRMDIIRALCEAGINIQCLFGCYGPARDEWISKAKLVLNLHSWEKPAPLEIVRLQLLFANRVCVVSEPGHPGELEWETYRGCMAEIDSRDPESAAFVIKGLLADQETRFRIGRMGYEAFAAHPQKDYLPL